MADDGEKKSFWSRMPPIVQKYAIFCAVMVAGVAYANHMGWYPTFGIFSGENSYHSQYHTGYHGGYGIHGK